MPNIAQDNRLLTVSTGLGKDVLLLTGFEGREEVSRPFQFNLELVSENDAIAPADIVGQPITWTVEHVHGSPRFFNGLVSRFGAGGMGARGLRSYRAEVVPWLWVLTHTSNCKIFQNESVDQIIKSVFDDFGFSDYRFSLKGSYAPRDYCVQYRETAFTFVSRLMEEEGIFYFFEHEDGKHTLVLANAKSAYPDCPEKEVRYAGAGTLAPNHISAWEHLYEFRPGKVTHTDYNFETPRTKLLATTGSALGLPGTDRLEMFDYPGQYGKAAHGSSIAKIRMEEHEVAHDVVEGASTCCTFFPGGKFSLAGHGCAAENKEYAFTAVQHKAIDPSHAGTGGGASYGNTFTCIPAAVVFRPVRNTPRASVQGPQTAVVVGPAGEEIFTDKHARIKVQFHWDREGKNDNNSSCWVRVATTWAGKGWGFLQIPRIGQEVVVDFLEGHPDRPIVIGSVYNAENMPAKGLPAAMKTSGLKTNSTPGGGGSNELTFDDTKGKEMVHLHAQYDMTGKVEHDDTHEVGHNRSDTIDVDDTLHVLHNRTVTVDNDHTETVRRNQTSIVKSDRVATVANTDTETVGTDQTLQVGGNRVRTVTKDESLTINGNREQTVAKNESVTINGNRTTLVPNGSYLLKAQHILVAAADETIVIAGDRKKVVQSNEEQSAGQNFSVAAGLNLSLQAGVKLQLSGPGGSITIDASGVTIQGVLVKIN